MSKVFFKGSKRYTGSEPLLLSMVRYGSLPWNRLLDSLEYAIPYASNQSLPKRFLREDYGMKRLSVMQY